MGKITEECSFAYGTEYFRTPVIVRVIVKLSVPLALSRAKMLPGYLESKESSSTWVPS